MHDHNISRWQHPHTFDPGNPVGERRTLWVIAITVATMLAEIIAGSLFKSMALLADGWHMGTHALALGVTAGSYALARRWAGDHRFAFGTWKIEVLGGFASAIVLGIVALLVAVESIERLINPQVVQYNQALLVAVIGLVVNLVCALLLDDHGHHHGHDRGHAHPDEHAHDHDHADEDDHAHAHADDHACEHHHHDAPESGRPHRDLNLRAAYLHVLADAATSVFAIAALLGGKFFGLTWLDPLMGIVGSTLIAIWSIGLVRDTGRVLLDSEMDSPLVNEVRRAIEADGDARISDLHLWRVGRNTYACIVVLVAARPRPVEEYRAALGVHPELGHIVIEIHRCPDPH